MFLEALRLNNFRSFDDETLLFSKDLTILVGENNGGKSNVIDALRLITVPLSKRREIYCETTDIRFGSTSQQFELESVFTDLNAGQQGRLISAIADHGLEKIVFGLKYAESSKTNTGRPSIWAGHLRGAPEPGCLDTIRHVYLPPLRDAKRALASGNPTRIYALLKHFLGAEEPSALASRLKRNTDEQILKDIGNAVDLGLASLTGGVRRQTSALGFSTDEALIDIARDLRFKLADHGVDPEDLRYTGHGYANLLYIATIAIELENARDADLTLFLLEEPEAHLHPQLQAAVLSFLEEQAEKSKQANSTDNGPSGQLQVIVATHSPNLSAWVSNKNIVFLRSVLASGPVVTPAGQPTEAEVAIAATAIAQSDTTTIAATTEATGTQGQEPLQGPPMLPSPPARRRLSRSIPLRALGLDDEDRRKIDRYLDVTKSSLLFGGRVLLVEGIAEALLLPVLARKYVLIGQQEKLRIFRSTVFVPIDGVDFECYLRLLLTPYNEVRIADRVIVITDGDRTNHEPGVITPGELRKKTYDEIAKELGATELSQTFINTYSLETELVNAGNQGVMKGIYLKLHPQSAQKWDDATIAAGDDRAEKIRALFKDTPKGDFAQLLAEAVHTGTHFQVPGYLRDAIEAVVL
jgi:putative ATP-dependent endonuclease of OLD family